MSFDPGVIFVVAIGIVGALFALGIASRISHTSKGKGFAIGAILLWLAGYAVVAGIVNFGTITFKPTQPFNTAASYVDVSNRLGLTSGTTYDLVLGGRIGGSTGSTNTTLTAGLFTAQATAQGSSDPASAVSLGYTVHGKTYILEIPTSRVTFMQSTTAKPSVTIWLAGESANFGYMTYLNSSYPYKSCVWQFHDLLPLCIWPNYSGWSSRLVVDRSTYNVGLGPVVSAGFQRAKITPTPDMYDQLLGIIK